MSPVASSPPKGPPVTVYRVSCRNTLPLGKSDHATHLLKIPQRLLLLSDQFRLLYVEDGPPRFRSACLSALSSLSPSTSLPITQNHEWLPAPGLLMFSVTFIHATSGALPTFLNWQTPSCSARFHPGMTCPWKPPRSHPPSCPCVPWKPGCSLCRALRDRLARRLSLYWSITHPPPHWLLSE